MAFDAIDQFQAVGILQGNVHDRRVTMVALDEGARISSVFRIVSFRRAMFFVRMDWQTTYAEATIRHRNCSTCQQILIHRFHDRVKDPSYVGTL